MGLSFFENFELLRAFYALMTTGSKLWFLKFLMGLVLLRFLMSDRKTSQKCESVDDERGNFKIMCTSTRTMPHSRKN